LAKWKKDVLANAEEPDFLLMGYQNLVNATLKEHPELCKSVENQFAALEHSEKVHDYAKLAAKVTVITGVCLFSEGMACAVAGGAAGIPDAAIAGVRANRSRDRLTALEGPSNLIDPEVVKSAHTDFMIKVAFAGVAMLPAIAQGASVAASETRAAVEGGSSVIASEITHHAGEVAANLVGQMGARALINNSRGGATPLAQQLYQLLSAQPARALAP
jgi:hypothetical protein